jgi:SAM-dependent methyltransferase
MSMLGQATAALEPGPRRWLQRVWGVPDIHVRQKWAAVWPELSALPAHGVHFLDAGCGSGGWTLEIAARRPGWTVVGIDRDADAIARANAAREQLGLHHASFVCADFRDACFTPRFDVVLSVASAHYLAASGQGAPLFQTFAHWLKPGGVLCLLGPRGSAHPFVERLPHPQWHEVFSADELVELSHTAGFDVESLSGCIGRAAIVAKQLAWATTDRPVAVRALMYPLEWIMTVADDKAGASGARSTLMWLLKARLAPPVRG